MGEHKKHLCPCGSGKHLRACCGRPSSNAKLELEETAWRLSKEGKHREACEVFERRVALSPDNPMIWNDLGNEYAAAGEMDKALAALKRAHEVFPAYPLPLYNLGKYTLDRCAELQQAGSSAKARLHDLAAEAIGYFKQSLERDPDNAACHQNLAIAYALTDDADKARAHTMEALRLDPSLKQPLRQLAENTRN
ncbi:MAG TPA: tetratricopeptide repeat protein [Acidobacteriaceae bacterium]